MLIHNIQIRIQIRIPHLQNFVLDLDADPDPGFSVLFFAVHFYCISFFKKKQF